MRGLLIVAGLLAVAGVVIYRQAVSDQGPAVADEGGILADVTNEIAGIGTEIMASITGYSPDKVPQQYRAAISQAEINNGIPAGMLARLLWQESRYREDIITGRKASPVGALGIAQFMPATAREWGIDPLNPESAIAGAGRYLAWLKKRTGGWETALAAYNWGIGNVLKKGIASAPTETRNYFQQIMADIGLGSYA